MKKLITTTGLLFFCLTISAQIEGTSLPSLPNVTTLEMNGATGVYIGSSVFNTDDQQVYRYTSSGWVTSSDDQFGDEVNLRVPVDMNGGATPTNENTVEEAIQAIAPITSASGRIFYPPSIAIDASTNGTGSVDLYQAYLDQFDSPVASSEAVDIPVYGRTDLYYYVTEADVDVFGNGVTVQNMSVNTNGVLSYEIFDQPVDYNSLINVVFVVK